MFDVFLAIIGSKTVFYALVAGFVLLPVFLGWIFHRSRTSQHENRLARTTNPGLPIVYALPVYDDVEIIEKQAVTMRNSGNFSAISRALKDHLDLPRTLTDGSRSYDSIVHVLLRPLYDCGDVNALVANANWYFEAHQSRPQDDNLLGLYLRALQVGAWRAAEFASLNGDQENWKQSISWLQEIESVFAERHLDPGANPLFAEAWYHAATLGQNAAAELTRRFPAMVRADAQNLRFWELRAYHLTPQLWGTIEQINDHMEWAVSETQKVWAESAVINVLRAVMDHIDPFDLAGLTDRRLVRAVADLSCELSAQEDINALLNQMILRGWEGLPELIMRDYVTQIVHPVWYRENDYLALASRANDYELDLPEEQPAIAPANVSHLRLVKG